MKKIIACLMVFLMLMSLGSFAEEALIIIDDNFNELTNVPHTYRNKTPGISDGSMEISNCPVTGSKALKLIDENNSSLFWLSGVAFERFFTPYRGEFTFVTDIVPMQINSHLNVLLRDSVSDVTAVNIQFIENGTIRAYQNPTSNSYLDIGVYKANKAIRLRLEVNIEENIYDVYLDDTLVLEGENFYNRNLDSGKKLKKGDFHQLDTIWVQGGVGVGEWYVDNLKLIGNTPNTATIPGCSWAANAGDGGTGESVETLVFDDEYEGSLLPENYYDRTASPLDGSITMDTCPVTEKTAVKITDLDPGSRFWLAGPAVERTFENQAGKILFSIDIVLTQRTAHLNLMLYDNTSDITAVNFQFIENGTIRHYHNDTDNSYDDLGIFNENEVQNIMIAADVGKNLYDLYFNGELVSEGVDFQNRSLDNQTRKNIGDCKQINSVWIQPGLGVGDFYITNMKLSSFVGDIRVPLADPNQKPKVTAFDIDEAWDKYEHEYTDESKIAENVYKRSDAIIESFVTNAQHNIPISATGDFYVSPLGNDENSGTEASPFLTVERARQAVSALISQGMTNDVTVLIREGEYILDTTVNFSLADSGNNGYKVIYAAYPNEKPVFTSAKGIDNFTLLSSPPSALPQVARGNVYVADVPIGKDFKMLYDGREILKRARSKGYQIESVTSENMRDVQTFMFAPGVLKNWSNLQDVEVLLRAFQAYNMNVLGLEMVDEATNTARTSLPAVYPILKSAWPTPGGTMTPVESLWVENTLEYLDEPGEWVLNSSTGKLYLWPKTDTQNISAPTLVEFFKVEGSFEAPANNIVFSGLTFTGGDRYSFTEDTITLQHEWEIFDGPNAMVRLRHADGITIEKCEFYNSGGTGIRSDLYGQNISIYGNTLYNLGGSGVTFSGYGPGNADVNRYNEIINNYIHHVGLCYFASPGIMMSQSGSNRIAYNEVHDTFHDSINLTGSRSVSLDPVQFVPHSYEREIYHTVNHEVVGNDYRWDSILPYLYTTNNIVEYNNVHRFGMMLGDVNGIYITGSGEDNVIRRNYIHDGTNYGVVAGMRTDDLQRGTYMLENVIYRTNYGGIQNKHRNYIMNNFLVGIMPSATGPDGETEIPAYGYLTLDRGSVKGAVAYHNILYQPYGIVNFIIEGSTANMAANINDMYLNRNLYYSVEAADRCIRYMEYLRGRDREHDGMAADPMFTDIENDDFTFMPGSPAIEMGIRELDVRGWGTFSEDPAAFMDISGHWASMSINHMSEAGIVGGVGNNRFAPDNQITRAEFIAIAARAIGLSEGSYNNEFSDVSATDWYAKILSAAKNGGIIDENLIIDNNILPNQPITREEMTSIIILAYEKTKPEAKRANISFFADRNEISDWAVGYVEKAYELSIIKGKSAEQFEPKSGATRGEAAVIIKRLTEK